MKIYTQRLESIINANNNNTPTHMNIYSVRRDIGCCECS